MAAEPFTSRRTFVAFVATALVAGVFFFGSLDHIWPLAATNVNAPPSATIPRASAFLLERGIDVRGHASASRLEVDEPLLEYLQRSFGKARTQEWIASGLPIYEYRIEFKQHGIPDSAWVYLHPERGASGWGRTVQEDEAGARLPAADARALADRVIPAVVPPFEKTGDYLRERPARTDHFFIFERHISREPELRERLTVAVTGDRVTTVERRLVLPESARRDARKRQAPVAALQLIGFLLVAAGGFAALVVFLRALAAGEVRMKRAAGWVGIVAVLFLVAQALRSAELLARWDPLWPRWISTFQSLGMSLASGAWIAFALFILIAAGDAVDRRSGAVRGTAFWMLGRGRLFTREVGLASVRGFLIGLICGAVLVGTLRLLEVTSGGWSGIQPQGFFFFAINSAAPAVATLCYFLMVALVEELGYRYFAGTMLLSVTGRKWIAIVLPGVVYGLSHTGLAFLPPVEPFWGRAVALSAVGCVWGWAFLRFDALTVILSHFTADLFIFSWPRMGSGDPQQVAIAILTVSVPLLPSVVLLLRRRDADRI